MSALKYRLANELREDICHTVGVDPGDRYRSQASKGLRKRHLLEIADALGIEADQDLTLRQLYTLICERAGAEYNENAGNQWALDRDCLKAIYRSLIDAAEGRGGDSE